MKRWSRKNSNHFTLNFELGEWLLLLLGGSALFFILAIVSFPMSCLSVNTPDAALEFASTEEIYQTVEDINSRLKILELVESSTRLEGDFPLVGFVMRSVSESEGRGTYFFEPMHYTVATGGEESRIPTIQLCKTIKSLIEYQSTNSILEELRRIELEGGLDAQLGSMGITTDLGWLVEMIYSLKKLLDLRLRRVEVLVKGYADGELGPWELPLMKRYRYTNVMAHQPSQPGTLNPFVYQAQPQKVRINNPYKNHDLPNLRGQFVKDDLIGQAMLDCPVKSKTRVLLLQGVELQQPRQELERKVQVHINIFGP